MKINNLKIFTQNMIPVLLLPIIISGCSEKSDCTFPNRHMHQYKKIISVNDQNNPNDDLVIKRYFNGENLEMSDYQQTNNIIELNKEDESFYNLIVNNELYYGIDNWEYLYHVMKKNHKDHLEFYYYYTTTHIYFTTDSKGHIHSHTRIVTHSGWSKDPKHRGNTGKVAYIHKMYYGYKIEEENGKLTIIESPLCEDIRNIIKTYPYFKEDPTKKQSVEKMFPKNQLSDVTLSDFNNPFGKPNLEDKSLGNKFINKPKIYKK